MSLRAANFPYSIQFRRLRRYTVPMKATLATNVMPVLAIIPARGGSKGVPGKNVRPIAGLPLIAHSIRLAQLCEQVTRCIVSTDSEEIAAVGRVYGAEVPFLRPAELAQDDTPMWPVLRHALKEMETREQRLYGSVLLLSPASPSRLPEDVDAAIQILKEDEQAVGVVAASRPTFNPRWTCVDIAEDGYIRQSFPDGNLYASRQQVPPTYRINGSLYLWRRDHLANAEAPDYYRAAHRMLELPEERTIDIDTERDFRLAELMLKDGMIRFPWL